MAQGLEINPLNSLNTLSLGQSTKIARLQQSGKLQQTDNKEQAKQAAQDFEAVFVTEFLKNIFPKETNELFGGGHGEKAYKSFLLDEYGKSIAKQGGFGIAQQVYKELIKTQEVRKRMKDRIT